MGDWKRAVPIEKVDEELRIVWGWAYECEKAGKQTIDHSTEFAEADEVQAAAHGFIKNSREGDVMHTAEVAGEIVDSIFFSADIQKALGIDLGKIGWFVGFRVLDDDAWEGVKKGKFRMFSIGGSAIATEVD